METLQNFIKIAIADEHKIFREGLQAVLERFDDFRVTVDAGSGAELLQKMEQSNGSCPDLCLLDINLPEMNGYITLKALKIKWPLVKVLVLSQFDNEYTILKMLQHGANGYVSKNINSNELHQAIMQICKFGFYQSNLVSNTIIRSLKQNDNKYVLNLTDKELQFLSYCCTDLSYAEIGKQMSISTSSAEKCRDVLFEKFNTHTRVGLAVFAILSGLHYINKKQ